MGQDGITSVLKRSRDPSLNQALERQKREYHDLQASAGDMLRARGIQPDGVSAVAKLSSGMMSAMKTMMDHSSTKIAEMMIQGSTMGVTKSLRTLRGLPPERPQGEGPGGQAAQDRAGQHRGDERVFVSPKNIRGNPRIFLLRNSQKLKKYQRMI